MLLVFCHVLRDSRTKADPDKIIAEFNSTRHLVQQYGLFYVCTSVMLWSEINAYEQVLYLLHEVHVTCCTRHPFPTPDEVQVTYSIIVW